MLTFCAQRKQYAASQQTYTGIPFNCRLVADDIIDVITSIKLPKNCCRQNILWLATQQLSYIGPSSVRRHYPNRWHAVIGPTSARRREPNRWGPTSGQTSARRRVPSSFQPLGGRHPANVGPTTGGRWPTVPTNCRRLPTSGRRIIVNWVDMNHKVSIDAEEVGKCTPTLSRTKNVISTTG